VILVSRSSDALSATKSAILQKANVSVDTFAADLSDSTNIIQLAHHYADIDILVNNAGAIPGGTLLNVDEANWRKAWDLKVFGYINMSRAFYAQMQKRKRGVIINVIGNAADTRDPEYICSVTGNAALAAFTQSLGSMSARDGIRVVAINPGPVATERLITLMKKKARERTGSEDNWKDLFKPLPFARGEPPRKSVPPLLSSPPTTQATPAAPSSRSMPDCPRGPRRSESGRVKSYKEESCIGPWAAIMSRPVP
jgi:3-oxoacyl-[acyl-carrier protein] reductase